MTKAEEKQALRRIVRTLEAQLSPQYRRSSSQSITAHLLAMPEYQAARSVFCFVGTSREIDTLPILKDVLTSGRRLCVPLCTAPGQMEAREITSLDQLLPGKYGIQEPPLSAPLVEVDDIDFAILPCLSCNRAGQRLGQGGGYYDRFLSSYRGGSILLCREQLMREEIPLESHDYPIPWVLTEKGLYEDGVPARLC